MSFLLGFPPGQLDGGSSNVKVQFVRCLVLCFVNVTLVILGGITFQAIEGSHELAYKCGVKRVHRDFINSLWNETSSMSETDWKSSARHKLMAFENELHEAVEAGVYSYSGQKSWTLANALLYTFSVISTMGFGPLTCSTKLCRVITCIFVVAGVPSFYLFITELARLLLTMFRVYVKKDYNVFIDQSISVVVGSLAGFASLVCFLNPFDAIYMVFGIISTNGFTDLQPQETFLMLLSSGLIVLSITIFNIFSISAQMRLRGMLNDFLKKFNIFCMEE